MDDLCKRTALLVSFLIASITTTPALAQFELVMGGGAIATQDYARGTADGIVGYSFLEKFNMPYAVEIDTTIIFDTTVLLTANVRYDYRLPESKNVIASLIAGGGINFDTAGQVNNTPVGPIRSGGGAGYAIRAGVAFSYEVQPKAHLRFIALYNYLPEAFLSVNESLISGTVALVFRFLD